MFFFPIVLWVSRFRTYGVPMCLRFCSVVSGLIVHYIVCLVSGPAELLLEISIQGFPYGCFDLYHTQYGAFSWLIVGFSF